MDLKVNDEKETYQDVNIMQIRNINHNITSTRLRILAQQDLPRRYVHKDQFHYDQTFDPIRMKFKVKTIEDATVTSGKGPEHYFIQAMKYCERNMIPQAIDESRKGLMIKPDHLQCRFNHGVLMFKLGLIKQSESDFQMLVDTKTKDPGAYYNLAIVKMQQGNYNAALTMIQTVMRMC
jgi:predicted Zn-dependent protease